MKAKTILIDTDTCQEVNLFVTEDDSRQKNVLIQAWHWFENKWHYQYDTLYFDYESLFENFIRDFSVESATAFARDFTFTK